MCPILSDPLLHSDLSLPSMPCGDTSAWAYPAVSPLVSNILLSPEWHEGNPSPTCQCSEGKRLTMMPTCPLGAGGTPPRQRREATGDVLLDLTGHNISDYLVKTYPGLIRTRRVAAPYCVWCTVRVCAWVIVSLCALSATKCNLLLEFIIVYLVMKMYIQM